MPKFKAAKKMILQASFLRHMWKANHNNTEKRCGVSTTGIPAEFCGFDACQAFYIWGMYSKKEASQLRQEFWTAFGQYLAPLLSAEGETINWINYRTGEKDISFRLTADNKTAAIAIELAHRDKDIQQLYYEQFLELRKFFSAAMEEEWVWQLHTTDDWGRTVSRIYTERAGVSVFRKEDWPALISFFKMRLVALDEFWSQVKYSFESLH